jgi:hypothetical protein
MTRQYASLYKLLHWEIKWTGYSNVETWDEVADLMKDELENLTITPMTARDEKELGKRKQEDGDSHNDRNPEDIKPQHSSRITLRADKWITKYYKPASSML